LGRIAAGGKADRAQPASDATTDLEFVTVAFDQAPIAITSNMAQCHSPTFRVAVDLPFDPAKPCRVRQGNSLCVHHTSVVLDAKSFDKADPAVAIFHAIQARVVHVRLPSLTVANQRSNERRLSVLSDDELNDRN